MPNITLGTLNIGKGATKFLRPNYSKQDVENTLRLIASLISEHSIDIMGLQEVDVNTDRNKNIDEPSFLRDELHWSPSSSPFEPTIDLNHGEDENHGKFGNAILVNLSKVELTYKDEKIQRLKLPKLVGREDQSAIAIRIDIQSESPERRNLWFLTTHLNTPFSDWTNQLSRILDWAKSFSFPVLVCGDFNVLERSIADGHTTAEYQLMKDIFEKYGFLDLGPFGDENFTFPRHATKKIDYMFLKDDRKWFNVDGVERIRPLKNGSWLSDHWAVVCSLSY